MDNNQNNNPQVQKLNNLNIAPNNSNDTQNTNRFINNVSNVNQTNLSFNNVPIGNNNAIQNTDRQDMNSSPIDSLNIEDNKLKKQVLGEEKTQFINKSNGYNETSLNDLNVDGKYNKLEKSIYSSDQTVRQNIENHEKKRVTVTITAEMKIFIIIAIIMFVFILIMPFIFDFVENIRFN